MSLTRPTGRGFSERIPLVLVLDTSASMARPEGSPRIGELNAALREWFAEAAADPAHGRDLQLPGSHLLTERRVAQLFGALACQQLALVTLFRDRFGRSRVPRLVA